MGEREKWESETGPGPTFILILLGELFYLMPFSRYTWYPVKESWGSLRGQECSDKDPTSGACGPIKG